MRRGRISASASRTGAGWPVLGVDRKKPPHGDRTVAFLVAEWTGLEPATPGVTGRYSNRLNYHSALTCSGFRRLRPEHFRTALYGVPTGIRTPVIAVKGRCPRPLDDGDCKPIYCENLLVEVSGIEPLTSCMPCKRSPS